jgi:HEAT repeat protein
MRPMQWPAYTLVVLILLSVPANPIDAQSSRPDRGTVADWRREARAESPAARSTAARALGTFGVPALPVLIDLLGDSDLDVRVQAVSSLGRLGAVAQPAAPALVRALDDPSVRLRRAAVLALGAITPVSDETLEAIIRSLADPDTAVQDNATWALRSLGGRAVPALTRAMHGDLPQVRLAATAVIATGLALRSLGPLPKETLAQLAQALADPDPDIRATAARALGNAGNAARPAVAGLRVVASSDPFDYVRSAASEAIDRIGRP